MSCSGARFRTQDFSVKGVRDVEDVGAKAYSLATSQQGCRARAWGSQFGI